MLQFGILPDRKVLIDKPKEPLETADFVRLGAEVDGLIRRGKGVLVHAPAFQRGRPASMVRAGSCCANRRSHRATGVPTHHSIRRGASTWASFPFQAGDARRHR